VYHQTFSIDNQVLLRICEKIVCRTHHQVNIVRIEPYSMKRIFLADKYPQLYLLSFINFEEKILYQYVIDILFDFNQENNELIRYKLIIIFVFVSNSW
jgi:hypothetical protein